MKKKLVSIMRLFLRKIVGFEILDSHTMFIRNCCKFIINNTIDGDYYEFGVFKGGTTEIFVTQYNSFLATRLKKDIKNSEGSKCRKRNSQLMQFHLFDSFQGLPSLKGIDESGRDFLPGQYSATEQEVAERLTKLGVNRNKLNFHVGWFNETFSPTSSFEEPTRKASIIWIDCDLYSSAKDVMSNLGAIVQDGTIVVFDDWFCFSGNPNKGVRKAYQEWISEWLENSRYTSSEYLTSGWALKSFIISERH